MLSCCPHLVQTRPRSVSSVNVRTTTSTRCHAHGSSPPTAAVVPPPPCRFTSDSRFSLGSLLPRCLPAATLPPPACQYSAGNLAYELPYASSLSVMQRVSRVPTSPPSGHPPLAHPSVTSLDSEGKGQEGVVSPAERAEDWGYQNPLVQQWMPRALLHGIVPAALLDIPMRWWRCVDTGGAPPDANGECLVYLYVSKCVCVCVCVCGCVCGCVCVRVWDWH